MLRRREWVNLNGDWEFGAGEERVFDRTITVPFCPQSELSGVGQTDLGDVVWYWRTFDAPPAERLLLHLGAVRLPERRSGSRGGGGRARGRAHGPSPRTYPGSRATATTRSLCAPKTRSPTAPIPRGKQHWTTKPESIFYTAHDRHLADRVARAAARTVDRRAPHRP